MDSCIYEGQVRHTRTTPVGHTFSYRLFMMYLDLDELPNLFEKRWFWSVSRPALARFRRTDHVGDPRQPLTDSVRDLVESETGSLLSSVAIVDIRAGNLAMYYPEANALVPRRIDERSKTPAFKCVDVSIRPVQ